MRSSSIEQTLRSSFIYKTNWGRFPSRQNWGRLLLTTFLKLSSICHDIEVVFQLPKYWGDLPLAKVMWSSSNDVIPKHRSGTFISIRTRSSIFYLSMISLSCHWCKGETSCHIYTNILTLIRYDKSEIKPLKKKKDSH